MAIQLEAQSQAQSATRPCPKCRKNVSIHASVCQHCWATIEGLDDPREQWARDVKINRHRTLSAVILCSAVVLTLFFVFLRSFLIRHVAAEQALIAAKPSHTAVHAGAPADPSRTAPTAASPEATTDASVAATSPAETASATEPAPSPTRTRRHHQPLDPADPMVVDDDDASPLAASSEQLQVVYIAIACSGFALIAAVVAFARAWR